MQGKTIVQRISETDYGFAIIAPHTKVYKVLGKYQSVFRFANEKWEVEITTKNAAGEVVSNEKAAMTDQELNEIVDLV